MGTIPTGIHDPGNNDLVVVVVVAVVVVVVVRARTRSSTFVNTGTVQRTSVPFFASAMIPHTDLIAGPHGSDSHHHQWKNACALGEDVAFAEWDRGTLFLQGIVTSENFRDGYL